MATLAVTQPTASSAPARASCWDLGWIRQFAGLASSWSGASSPDPVIRLRHVETGAGAVMRRPRIAGLASSARQRDGCPPRREARVDKREDGRHGGHAQVHRIGEVRDRGARGAGHRVPRPAQPEGRTRADVQAPLERVHERAPEGGPGPQGGRDPGGRAGAGRDAGASPRQAPAQGRVPGGRIPGRRWILDSPAAPSQPSGPGRQPGAFLRSVASLATVGLIAPRRPTWAPTGEPGRSPEPSAEWQPSSSRVMPPRALPSGAAGESGWWG
jgi:hypothetical protein